MIRRKVLGTLISLSVLPALAGTAPAFALDRLLTDDEKTLITEINDHNTAIRTMAGRFLQIDARGNRTEGTFFLERPDKIAFRYAPPSRESIISVGRGFYVLDRKEHTYYAYPQDQVPLRQFLADKIDLFQANILDVVSTDSFISVTISDQTLVGTVQVALIFSIDTKDLTQWTLTDPSGGELTFSVYDVVQNVEIPKAMFYIDSSYTPKATS